MRFGNWGGMYVSVMWEREKEREREESQASGWIMYFKLFCFVGKKVWQELWKQRQLYDIKYDMKSFHVTQVSVTKWVWPSECHSNAPESVFISLFRFSFRTNITLFGFVNWFCELILWIRFNVAETSMNASVTGCLITFYLKLLILEYIIFVAFPSFVQCHTAVVWYCHLLFSPGRTLSLSHYQPTEYHVYTIIFTVAWATYENGALLPCKWVQSQVHIHRSHIISYHCLGLFTPLSLSIYRIAHFSHYRPEAQPRLSSYHMTLTAVEHDKRRLRHHFPNFNLLSCVFVCEWNCLPPFFSFSFLHPSVLHT